MNSNAPLEFVTSVLCEEIRDEINNKHSLLGVFSGHVAVQSFPANVRLAVYAEVNTRSVGSHKFELNVSYAGASMWKASGEFTAAKVDLGAFVIPTFMVNAEKPGEVIVTAKFEGGDPIEFMRRRIEIGVVPSLVSPA